MIKINDKILQEAINNEELRQYQHLELIASENYVSDQVREVAGSILTNKYAEGYPGKRYYGGCENVDVIESLAIERAKQLFDAKYANVQPHSGSQANMAVFRSLLKPGDVVLGMGLDQGGHLTHGHPLSFSGQDYQCHAYYVNEEGFIDYQQLKAIALELKPKMIIAGASAYPRIIDFSKFREIADLVGAYLMADIAHIAGLVITKLHPSPFPYADVVTSTTHKTLRGPRGGLILTNSKDIAKKIDQMIFPGIQGGPLMHIIGAKAAAFAEALEPQFTEYQKQVIINAKTLADELIKKGYRIISGGTDNHMVLVDVMSSVGLTGKQAENLLHQVNITCNKNTIPNDTQKPMHGSGIRLGTPALSTRGFDQEAIKQVAEFIDLAFKHHDDNKYLEELKKRVEKFASGYPLFATV